jgi:hypothetical protein
MSNKDLLSLLILESKSYSQVEDLEKLVENSKDLSALPIQPLYLSVKTMGLDQIANLLPKMSEEQRQALIDLDAWNKDQLDMKRFSEWPIIYSKCNDDEVVLNFLKSEDFALFLKSRFNIYTFDAEDPEYPDHDNYFLTEDNLLLVEFDPDFEHVGEMKALIRKLYDDLGVEKAYSHLFKIISDSYSVLEEECYNDKKERLRDFGFVDYHDALYLKTTFVNLKSLEDFVRNKKSVTGEIEDLAKNQTLHSSSLAAYQNGLKSFFDELELLTDNKRKDFLQFNFVRLVNSSLSVSQALKEGSIAITRVGNQTRQYLEVGFNFIHHLYYSNSELKAKLSNQGLFEIFDFYDLYKVGFSLIHFELTAAKKVLTQSPFCKDEFEYFLGHTLIDVLDLSFSEIVKIKKDKKVINVSSLEDFTIWKTRLTFLSSIIPFAMKFFATFSNLKEKNLVNDNFYLNYEVDNIDLESILISSLINFSLGTNHQGEMNKMGLTVVELKKFVSDFFVKEVDGDHVPAFLDSNSLSLKIQKFNRDYGLSTIDGMDLYMHGILDEQLSGYHFNELDDEEFKHVGGPILLNTTAN